MANPQSPLGFALCWVLVVGTKRRLVCVYVCVCVWSWRDSHAGVVAVGLLGRAFGGAGAHQALPSTAGGAVGFSDLSPEAAGWVTLTTRLSTALRDSLSWVLALGFLSCVWVGQLGFLFLALGAWGPGASATPLIRRMLEQPCRACLACLSMAPSLAMAFLCQLRTCAWASGAATYRGRTCA